MRPHNKPVQAGFTLLELLLAMALSAMILALLAGGTYMVVRDWEKAESRLDDSLDASLALLQIERALQGAYPHLYRDKKTNRDVIYFEGKKDELRWVSSVSPSPDSGLTAWELSRGKEDKGLSVKYVPAYAINPDKNLDKAEETLLFEDYKVSFEYLNLKNAGRSQDSVQEDWRNKWSGEDLQRLPQAVRIRLEKDNDNENLELIALIAAYEHERISAKQVRD